MPRPPAPPAAADRPVLSAVLPPRTPFVRRSRLALTVATHRRYLALALLCMVLGVASVERSALSVAGPELLKLPGFDATTMGWLFAAFGWSYVLAHLPVGVVVARWGVHQVTTRALAAGACISLAMALAGAPLLASAAAWLMLGLRVLLGVVQAPIGSTSGVVLSQWFPSAERGLAGSVYTSMPYLALALMNPLMGAVTEHLGWRAMFGLLAAVGLAAAGLWASRFSLPAGDRWLSARERRLLERGGAMWRGRSAAVAVPVGAAAGSGNGLAAAAPAPDPAQTDASTGTGTVLWRLFSHRMMVGTLLAQYAIAAITWFFVGWFPLYLVHDFGASTAEAAALSAIPALAGFAGGLATGLFSDRVLRRTGNLTLARKLPVYIGMSVAAAAMLACLLASHKHVAVALMALSFFGKQFGTLGWTLVADLAPRNKVEFTGSVVNAVGNLSGVFTPLLIGWLVASTGRFDAALVLVAAHAVLALASHAVITGPLRRMPNL